MKRPTSAAVRDALAAGMGGPLAERRAPHFEPLFETLPGTPTPVHLIHVPGRIEVLGKHTDYAGGRSLVCAVESGFAVVATPRDDKVVHLRDALRSDEVALTLDQPAAGNAPHWATYPAAVVRRLARDFGGPLRGANVVFASDLPPSSGLSSSSALLIATFEALSAVNDLDEREDVRAALPGVLERATYLGCVESGRPFGGFDSEAGVGTRGGSQDHTAILASASSRLTQVSYAPPRIEARVALPDDRVFVVAASGVIAQKTQGARAAYNAASDRATALLELWQAETGRVDATLFEALADGSQSVERLRSAVHAAGSLDETERSARLARLDQFVDEVFTLIPQATAALGRGDLVAFGSVVDRSQAGAERGLGNQVPETIALASIARSLGADAASAFGAGFGGSVWALVKATEASDFAVRWQAEYLARFPHPSARFLITSAGPPLVRSRL